MASVKHLKQNINNIAGELFSECLFCRLYIPGVDPEKADAVLTKILQMQDEFICRSNHPDGVKNPLKVSAFYRKLRKDLAAKTEEIVKEIQLLNN